MTADPPTPRDATTPPVDEHEFDPGDHAFIEPGHLCHDCGKPLEQHQRVPEYVRNMIAADRATPKPHDSD